jgi:hypothetical protein
MPTLNLKNITIKKLEDRNFKPYFLIVNNDNSDEAFPMKPFFVLNEP